MPAVAAGTFPIALGDWKSGYITVDKLGVRYLRDPFSNKPSVMFYGYKRTGGSVANFDAIKLMKIAAA
jgi:HK97 family phage major capsid protein